MKFKRFNVVEICLIIKIKKKKSVKENFCISIFNFILQPLLQSAQSFMRNEKDPDPHPDPYL
jgi:hypothetical protein